MTDNETDRQKRDRLYAEIVETCGLDNERVLRQQLDSFNELQIEVTHRLIMRAENGLATYWKQRAERAEQVVIASNSNTNNTSNSNIN